MRSKYLVIVGSVVVLLLGCSAPANLTLQSYDEIQTDPEHELLPPPKRKAFTDLPGVKTSFTDPIKEYDESLKSYERYIRRNHEKVVTKRELEEARKAAEVDYNLDEWVNSKEFRELGIPVPDCKDNYFTMPPMEKMPQAPSPGSNLAPEEIAAASLAYAEDLRTYIDKSDRKIQASILAYNRLCKE